MLESDYAPFWYFVTILTVVTNSIFRAASVEADVAPFVIVSVDSCRLIPFPLVLLGRRDWVDAYSECSDASRWMC